MICSYCQIGLIEGPISNLQCGHIIHTRCLLIDSYAHKTFDYIPHCPSCEQTWMDDEFFEDADRRIDTIELRRQENFETRHQILTTTLQANDTFQPNLLKLRKYLKECSDKRRKLTQRLKRAKHAFSQITDCSIQYLRMLSKQTITSLKESTEYKLYVNKQRKKDTFIRYMLRQYNMLDLDLSNHVPLERGWKATLRTSLEKSFKPII